MKTILVLTDFSDTAFHATCYAAGIASQLHCTQLILYHAYETVLPLADTNALSNDISGSLRASSMSNLKALHNRLEKYLNNVIAVRYRTENLPLESSINDVAEAEGAELIVMGITGKSALEKTLVGSTTIRVAEKSRHPLLIVPADAVLQPVSRLLFACDIEQTTRLKAAAYLKMVLDALAVPLMVVNVGQNNMGSAGKTPEDAVLLRELLSPYHPSFHYTESEDTVEGIMNFAEANHASMILVIPKTQQFWQGLFHRSVTKKLAYHSSIPLLVLHEIKPGETQGSVMSQI